MNRPYIQILCRVKGAMGSFACAFFLLRVHFYGMQIRTRSIFICLYIFMVCLFDLGDRFVNVFFGWGIFKSLGSPRYAVYR